MTSFSLWMREVQLDNPFIDTGNLAQMAWEEGVRAERHHLLTLVYDLARECPEGGVLATKIEARLAADARRAQLREN